MATEGGGEQYVARFGEGKLGLAFAMHGDGCVRVQRASLQAEREGCCAGDVIVAVDGTPLGTTMDQEQVTRLMVGAERPFAVTFVRRVT
jgi:hypothetical protein